MSKFFKSTWFKCISFLLMLAVVLGGTLAILNDILYVSPEERTARAIKKIYGEEKEYSITFEKNSDENPYKYDCGELLKIYNVGEDMLFQTVGFNGYKGGTITLWIKVVKNETNSMVIEKIVVESYDKQTLMSKFDGSYSEKFYENVTTVGDDNFFVPNTGATYSAKAYNNAVKCVSEFFKGVN